MHSELLELVPELEGSNNALLYGGLQGEGQLAHLVTQLGRGGIILTDIRYRVGTYYLYKRRRHMSKNTSC